MKKEKSKFLPLLFSGCCFLTLTCRVTNPKEALCPTLEPVPTVTPAIVPTATPTAKPLVRPTQAVKKVEKEPEAVVSEGVWVGGISHYSHAGCLGCSKDQTMANGQKFDENAFTIAFNWLPLNTRVRVTNLDNGASAVATVTDRHGAYNAKHHWRIADLSKGLGIFLGTKTDKSKVKIEVAGE
jgi:rare lipoprotein A (peptidoglycan hydrolase)